MKLFCLLFAASLNFYTAPVFAKESLSLLGQRHTVNYEKNTQAQALAQSIALRHNLEFSWVLMQMNEAKYLPRVVKLMKPSPVGMKKNWALYRSRFVTPTHIQAGVVFWRTHQQALTNAEAQYGVPASLVVGILGVESIYGRDTGNFRVLDALATLAFDYPSPHPNRSKRIAYFQSELEHFFLLAKQMNRSPSSYLGSYAGAMGWPQFMPSSWRTHAVDFDTDGQIDLWQSPSDIVGSVANYFKNHGWKNAPQANDGAPLESRVVMLENGARPPTQYLTDENFYVITKYNDSHYYAAAVLELAAAIEAQLKLEQQR